MTNYIVNAILGFVVIAIGFTAAVAYPRLQYSAVRQLRGVWLGLSLVPLGVMAIVGVSTGIGLYQGSNLWPLLLIFTAPFATAYLLVLRFAERHVGERR